MQPTPQQKLSRLRQELRQLWEQLGKTLQIALADSPLIQGTVYQIARRCGSPNCRCTRGQLHRSMVLTWTEQGRHRMRSLPPQQVAEIRRKNKEYARFRRVRAEVSRLQERMLARLDQIQQLRREVP